jgi:hypothetical protein
MRILYFAPAELAPAIRRVAAKSMHAKPGQVILLDAEEYEAVQSFVAVQMVDEDEETPKDVSA